MRQNQNLNTVSDSDRPESFQLKGGLFPMSLLELKSTDLDHIKAELTAKVTQAPGFFQNSAVVIGLDQLSASDFDNLDLAQIQSLCRRLELIPTAIRGGDKQLVGQAIELGMAVLPKSKGGSKAAGIANVTSTASVPAEELTTEAVAATEAETSSVSSTTEAADASDPAVPEAASIQNRIITTPIRSGQQIYARGGDLIIMTSVSAGAEVLADGNIHVYGPLRGRALAGVQGNTEARIFCSSQEAELVSIAGQFLVDEVLRQNHWKKPVQIYIDEGRLVTSPLV